MTTPICISIVALCRKSLPWPINCGNFRVGAARAILLAITVLGLFALGCERDTSKAGKPGPEPQEKTIAVREVIFSPDGATLLALGTFSKAWMWDGKFNEQIWKGELPGGDAQFFGDGTRVVFARGGTVSVWDVKKRQTQFKIKERDNYCSGLLVTPDQQFIIWAGAPTIKGLQIRIWDVEKQGLEKGFLADGVGQLHSMMVSRNGKNLLLVAGEKPFLQELDLDNGTTQTFAGPLYKIWRAKFLSRTSIVALHREPNEVCTYTFPEGKKTLLGVHDDLPLAVAVSPDGRLVVSAGFKKLILWQIDPPKQVWTVDVPKGFIYAGAFSPDGKSVVVGGGSEEKGGLPILYVFDVASGELTATLLKG